MVAGRKLHVARRHRFKGLRVNDVGPPAEEDGVDILHQQIEGLTDVVVPIRHSPAAVLEASIAILV
jgi:hypothetical protein